MLSICSFSRIILYITKLLNSKETDKKPSDKMAIANILANNVLFLVVRCYSFYYHAHTEIFNYFINCEANICCFSLDNNIGPDFRRHFGRNLRRGVIFVARGPQPYIGCSSEIDMPFFSPYCRCVFLYQMFSKIHMITLINIKKENKIMLLAMCSYSTGWKLLGCKWADWPRLSWIFHFFSMYLIIPAERIRNKLSTERKREYE